MNISFMPKIKPSAPQRNSFLPKKPPASREPKPAPVAKDKFIPRLEALEPSAPVAAPVTEPSAPRLSLDSLNSAQNAALAALPAPAAAALRNVWNVVDSSADSKQQLLELLEEGTLAASDQEQSVAERLRSLTSRERAPGFDGQSLTMQTIALLAEPDEFTTQGNRFTCGAANLQCQLAENPALLSKAIDELSDPEGSLELSPGILLSRPFGTQADDGSGRNEVNRLLQGSLMKLASASGDYDGSIDRFADGSTGLKPLEIAKATSLLKGKEQGVLLHNGDTYKVFHQLVKDTPEGESFQVGASWEGQDHMLLYLGQEEGKAKFFDAQSSDTLELPMADFLFKCQFAILPKERLQGIQVPEDCLYFNPAE